MGKIVLDRRVQKTRKLLQDALVELILEKGFESVRIQDILDRANVGRSTFYFHFQDKRELLHSCFDELHDTLEQHAERISGGEKNSGDIHHEYSLKLFRFVERNHTLFKALLGKQDVPAFVDDFLFAYIQEPFRTRMVHDKLTSFPPELVTYYFAYAFIGTLKWWVSQDTPCTAEEIGKYFEQLVISNVKGILHN